MQKNKEAQKRATAKYDAANTRQITLKLNRGTDKDVLDKLNATGNRQGYIKELIRADLAKNGEAVASDNKVMNSSYPANLITHTFMAAGIDEFYNKDAVKVAVNMLPEKERDVLLYVFRDNMNYKEVAIMLGVDISTIHDIEKAAFMDLKKPEMLKKFRRVVTVNEYQKLINENEALKAKIKYLSQTPEKLAEIRAMPLEEAGYLSFKTIRILKLNGYNKVGEIADHARVDIATIDGIGTMYMNEIDEMMMSLGLIFMGDSDASKKVEDKEN